jgi:ABC-type lipoprotein export system ATPase subunit
MLSFQNVTKDFRLDVNTTITPVKNVTLDVNQGEFIIIIGRSGTGKTTLLNLAAGLVKTTTGKVSMDNMDLGEMTDKQLSMMRNKKIGFVFQFPSLLPSFTVLENVMIPSICINNNKRKEAYGKALEILDLLGISGKKDVYPKQLSAGEQKRVVISRSLINNPDIILADEPTSDLDNQTEKEVMSLLKEVNSRGATLLIVTHSLQLLPFATRAFNMENGGLNEINRVEAG